MRCGGKAQAALQHAGVPFKVHPKGQRRYSFVISNNQFNISIAGESELNAPSVYMQISSELLTLCGYQNSLAMARDLVSHILSCADTGKISRIDLCCDFTTNLDWSAMDLRAWVCRSLKRSEYREANIFTGYVFGLGGDVLAKQLAQSNTLGLFFVSIFSCFYCVL
ncbi:hypothetical protein GCM10027170_26580 [Aliiglaciecola aliphaticivorans]